MVIQLKTLVIHIYTNHLYLLVIIDTDYPWLSIFIQTIYTSHTIYTYHIICRNFFNYQNYNDSTNHCLYMFILTICIIHLY
jgi:hypothetical protein